MINLISCRIMLLPTKSLYNSMECPNIKRLNTIRYIIHFRLNGLYLNSKIAVNENTNNGFIYVEMFGMYPSIAILDITSNIG